MKLQDKIAEQINQFIEQAQQFAPTIVTQANKYGSMTDANFDHDKFSVWNIRCLNLLSRIENGESIHFKKFLEQENRGRGERPVKGRGYHSISIEVSYKVAILKALKLDIETGNFFDQELLITADAFGDILEQSEHLLNGNYKDASAVLIGAVLESSLRKICDKTGISYSPMDTINPLNNLLKDKAYNRIIHKQIIAWADLRNKAAHGKFDGYTSNQVSDMLKWVQDFVSAHIS
jgi:hypothetical protein